MFSLSHSFPAHVQHVLPWHFQYHQLKFTHALYHTPQIARCIQCGLHNNIGGAILLVIYYEMSSHSNHSRMKSCSVKWNRRTYTVMPKWHFRFVSSEEHLYHAVMTLKGCLELLPLHSNENVWWIKKTLLSHHPPPWCSSPQKDPQTSLPSSHSWISTAVCALELCRHPA